MYAILLLAVIGLSGGENFRGRHPSTFKERRPSTSKEGMYY